ncbi:MAG: hypothetical protein JO202_05845 [Ktedonobacteraceae bacterium]|nr:hypothetical protein [Ktedonobacteraceae bacterium]
MMQRHLYPGEWERLAHECKERAGWRCEVCRVPHGTMRVSRRSHDFYFVRLAAHHIDGDTGNPQPVLKCLCERCHGKLSAFGKGKKRRRNTSRYLKPRNYIGPVEAIALASKLGITLSWNGSQWCYASAVSSGSH